jgi:hypothetical protein
MKLASDPRVEVVFQNYPKERYPKMMYLRQLVLEVAEEIEGLDQLEETLKWGEPSYIAKKGSTLRMAWKASKLEQYAMYFKCTSKLVLTFKEIYKDPFNYEKNRAIVFKINDKIPVESLKYYILMTLSYHNLKHLPLLGS